MSNHTPGPWHAGPRDWLISQSNGMGYRNFPIRGVEEFDIAMVYCDEYDGEQEANVSLIAAAPELLRELKYAVSVLQDNHIVRGVAAALAAIRQAEGRLE